MEQHGHAILDPNEVNTEQGGDAPAAVLAGEVAGAEEGEPERVTETDNSVRAAATEGSTKQDHEVSDGDSVWCATRKTQSEDREAFENTMVTQFEFRAADAVAAPPSTFLRTWSRGRKQAGLTEFVAAGDADGAGSKYPVLGASSSSGPATGTHEHVSVMLDGDQGAAPGGDRELKRACSAPGATVAIAHASPPDSYRRMPWRSRKQYSPKRFVAAAGAPPSAAAPPSDDRPLPAASLCSALPSASGTGAASDTSASSGVFDFEASSSKRPASRGRKQLRPEHFIPEEAEATASAKARRSDIVLDRFLSSRVQGSSASEWVRNVTAQDAPVDGERQRGVKGFRIRDASHHAARALSRLGCTSPSSSSAAAGGPPGEPGGKGRLYGVLAVLGASLALTVVSCMLFYIAGQRSEPGLSREKPDE